jgi:tetratricopeptide (TPR) repeat protein
MSVRICARILLIAVTCCAVARADSTSDAEKLKGEALEILKANSARQATPEQYADCIFKLEKAQQILDKANDNDSALAQEVSSSLFWARKFSDVHVIAALDKLHGGAKEPAPPPPPPAKKPDPAKAPDEAESEVKSALAEAKKAFSQAEAFAQSHSGDDYAVALRWFKVANDNSGTDYALKALDLAREAQTRFATKSQPAPVEKLPDTPEMKLVIDGDALTKAGKFEEAIGVYKASLGKKETIEAHRQLAHAYFSRGQQLKDKLMPELEKADQEYQKAYKAALVTHRSLGGRAYLVLDRNNPGLLAAVEKSQALGKQSYKVVSEYYDRAQAEFKSVVRMATDGKDLDADGHICLCLSVRGDNNYRMLARQHIVKFLADYKPTTDLERSLYEYCKTELVRLKS